MLPFDTAKSLFDNVDFLEEFSVIDGVSESTLLDRCPCRSAEGDAIFVAVDPSGIGEIFTSSTYPLRRSEGYADEKRMKTSVVFRIGLYFVGLSTLVVTAIAAPSLATGDDDTVVVLFSPLVQDGTALRAVTMLGAPIAAIGKAEWIVMTGPLDPTQREALKADGALLFLNGSRAAWLCGSPTQEGS